jgi:hypothetical protein
VAPCRYFVNRCFGETDRLHLQGIRNPRAMNQCEQVAVVPEDGILNNKLYYTVWNNMNVNNKHVSVFCLSIISGPWNNYQGHAASNEICCSVTNDVQDECETDDSGLRQDTMHAFAWKQRTKLLSGEASVSQPPGRGPVPGRGLTKVENHWVMRSPNCESHCVP